MEGSIAGTPKKRTERAFESQSRLLEELEVSMLLQSHEDAKAELDRTEVEKQASSKLKAKHCKRTCRPAKFLIILTANIFTADSLAGAIVFPITHM